jgi:subtilisin family serine protease
MRHGGKRANELLIRFRNGVSHQQQNATLAALGVREWRPLRGKSRVVKAILNPGQHLEPLIASPGFSPQIELAEPNYLIYQDSLKKTATIVSSSITKAAQAPVPNDPRFRDQWALQNSGYEGRLFGADIQVTGLWEHTTGQTTSTVAVLDSGIDFTHQDLARQRWTNFRETLDGRDEDTNGFTDDAAGWNFVKDNNSATDQNGHGTSSRKNRSP